MYERWDVVVVGGGLAGLTAAAVAADRGASVLLLDRHDPGGRATSDVVAGFRLNRGAHALYRATPGRRVLRRLGVVVRGESPPIKGALGRRGDQVGEIGLGVVGLARCPLLGPRDKARLIRVFAGMRQWKPDRLADRSAADWFDDLGLGGGARDLFETLARTATYVADMTSVSADLVAAQVRAAATDGVEYLHGGWASLVDGLTAVVSRRGALIRTGVAVRSVEPDGGAVRVRGWGGEVLARRVVLAAGTPAACGALLPEPPARWSRIGPPARAACLDVALGRVPDMSVLLGIDRPLYLIRHSPPASLAPEGGAVVHGLRYLRPDEDPSPEQARGELEAHARIAGLDLDAAIHVRYLHRMTVCNALPAPGVGLVGRLTVTDTDHDGVLVAGDWIGPDGHLADAALTSGEAAGRVAVDGMNRDRVVRPIMDRAS